MKTGPAPPGFWAPIVEPTAVASEFAKEELPHQGVACTVEIVEL